jgi:hypothetical protein
MRSVSAFEPRAYPKWLDHLRFRRQHLDTALIFPCQTSTLLQVSLSKSLPLHPEWLAPEEEASLLSQIPIQAANSQAGKDRNARLLSRRDAHLKQGIQIHDTFLELGVETRNVDMNYQVRPSSGRTHL